MHIYYHDVIGCFNESGVFPSDPSTWDGLRPPAVPYNEWLDREKKLAQEMLSQHQAMHDENGQATPIAQQQQQQDGGNAGHGQAPNPHQQHLPRRQQQQGVNAGHVQLPPLVHQSPGQGSARQQQASPYSMTRSQNAANTNSTQHQPNQQGTPSTVSRQPNQRALRSPFQHVASLCRTSQRQLQQHRQNTSPFAPHTPSQPDQRQQPRQTSPYHSPSNHTTPHQDRPSRHQQPAPCLPTSSEADWNAFHAHFAHLPVPDGPPLTEAELDELVRATGVEPHPDLEMSEAEREQMGKGPWRRKDGAGVEEVG
jgi:hypothetical protein